MAGVRLVVRRSGSMIRTKHAPTPMDALSPLGSPNHGWVSSDRKHLVRGNASPRKSYVWIPVRKTMNELREKGRRNTGEEVLLCGIIRWFWCIIGNNMIGLRPVNFQGYAGYGFEKVLRR